MKNNNLKWNVINKLKANSSKLKVDDVVNILLENRGIKTKKEREEYFNPVKPEKITFKSIGLKRKDVDKAISRIKKACRKKERIIIYGDYDADGVCATAILWETLYELNKNCLPYIPERFSEGYGLNAESVKKLKAENSKLKVIITVDNGIVAHDAVDAANKLGIDVIITDHHIKEKKLPKAYAILHSTKVSGAGLAWIFAKELKKCHPEIFSGSKARGRDSSASLRMTRNQILKQVQNDEVDSGLELVAIGTIADQVPLLGVNRSLVKYGLVALNKTKRPGLLESFRESGLYKGHALVKEVGVYEVGFVIAPRINAMGRMKHAIDSLRLLCTKDKDRAYELANLLGKTNKERQQIVHEVVLHAREKAKDKEWKGAIIISHESYHEGVIGLAASKLVNEFYRPAIVLSRGQKYSKASARSISGFNIIESIRSLETLIIGGGGHPMAAGFSIETNKIKLFEEEFEKVSTPLLSSEVLTKQLRVDLEIDFSQVNWDLDDKLKKFEPCGIGNPRPTFVTRKINVLGARPVGRERNHLKLKLEKDEKVFDAIAFGLGDYYSKLLSTSNIDIAYNIEENIWNGKKSLQLKIKDIQLGKN